MDKEQINWEDEFKKDFIKKFSVIGFIEGEEHAIPVIGRFIKGKKAGEEFVNKVPTKEVMDYIVSSLGTLPDQMWNSALEAASEAVEKFNRTNTYEDSESAVFKTTLKEIQSLLLSLKRKI